MPKISTLTAPIHNPISVLEYAESGNLEEIVFNLRHKRLTSSVLNEVDAIHARIYAENRRNLEAQKKTDDANQKKAQPPEVQNRAVQKNIFAAQLAFLVEYTDIESETGEILPPTEETFLLLSINAQTRLMEGVMRTTMPEKKSSSVSSDGMSPAGDSEQLPIG